MRRASTAIVCILSFAVTVWAYPDASLIGPATGAPSGSGIPAEGTCADCHGALNTGPGNVSFYGLGQYSLGEIIDMGVQIEHIGQGRWGFMVTALNTSGQSVGTFSLTDAARTRLLSMSGRSYVAHTASGTDAGVSHQTAWFFRWTAPAQDVGPVTFYLSALAANNNNSTGGDFTYTKTFSLGYSAVLDGDGATGPGDFALAQNYPNPFNAGTALTVTLARQSHVSLEVFDILGRRAAALVEGVLPAGTHEYYWDGTLGNGTPAPSGVYLTRLSTLSGTKTRKMTLLR